MSDPGPQQGGAGGAPGEPSEEQLRAAYEEELSRIDATDMIAQATVSLLNIGAHRLAPAAPPTAGESPAGSPAQSARDLDQARDAIDAVRALLEILERRIPAEVRPLRDALSRLQMVYAQEMGAAAPSAPEQPASGEPPRSGPAGAPAGPAPSDRDAESPGGPGPAEASGRLWVPGR